MKVNVDRPIVGFDGEPLKDGGKVLTLKDVAIFVLLTALPNDQGDAKTGGDRFQAAKKIADAEDGVVDLTAEQIALIKPRAYALFANALIGGRVSEMLEGE